MKRPIFLYHGSARKLEELLPMKSNDLKNIKDNSLKGVYASSWKKWAIIMGLLSCRGMGSGSTHITGKNKIDAVYYGKGSKQKYFYLYTFSSKGFKNIPLRSPHGCQESL